jgi:hypothetical protein
MQTPSPPAGRFALWEGGRGSLRTVGSETDDLRDAPDRRKRPAKSSCRPKAG